MALHRLLSMEIGVPEPAVLDAFYAGIGLSGDAGTWGGSEQPDQIRVVEAPYRQLHDMTIGCDDESDLAAAAERLDALGVKSETGGGRLRVTDPVNKWRVTVVPTERFEIGEQPVRVRNRPGHRPRVGSRAELITETTPRPPRRLGHVVVGTPDPVGTRSLFEAIGYRVSDSIAGMATFMRCSPDHHNLLIAPGRVPYLNHYALEHDDFDAVARAGTLYLAEHGDAFQVAGPGRHQIGGNEFWYLKDPAGNFFEFFSDMDRIEDDEAWEIGTDWTPQNSWSLWGADHPPEIFFNPVDLDEIAAGFERQHGS